MTSAPASSEHIVRHHSRQSCSTGERTREFRWSRHGFLTTFQLVGRALMKVPDLYQLRHLILQVHDSPRLLLCFPLR
jgi:hypothetical protein